MDEESIRRLAGECFPKLLQRPFRRWVGRRIAVQNATRAKLEGHKHMKQPEPGRHGDHEITRDDRIGVVAHKCRPVL